MSSAIGIDTGQIQLFNVSPTVTRFLGVPSPLHTHVPSVEIQDLAYLPPVDGYG